MKPLPGMSKDGINMGRKSQAKGRSGELELARILQSYGYSVEPGQAVSYGATPDLTGLPGVHIECKRAQQQKDGVQSAIKSENSSNVGDNQLYK